MGPQSGWVRLLRAAIGCAILAYGVYVFSPVFLPLIRMKLAMRQDPKVGDKVALPPIEDLEGRPARLPLAGPITGLLYVRDWQGTSFDDDLRLLEDESAKFPMAKSCVVFAHGDVVALRAHLHAAKHRSVFLYDKEGKVGGALNAVAINGTNQIDRFYMLKGDGALLYVENPFDDNEKVVREAEEIIRDILRGNAQHQAE